MWFRELLGRFVTLTVDRFIPAGALLCEVTAEGEEPPALLLPRSEVPEGTVEGHDLEVFLYLDSDDRPIATLRTPYVALDEVAFLEITDVTDIGGFADWGLVKELFIPFREQVCDLRIGEIYPIGLYLDSSDRLAGTMRIRELLHDEGDFEPDEWVQGEIWRKEPGIGVFVILERGWVGLIPASEPCDLTRGARVKARVANVLADGKIELSMREHAHKELENDAKRILEVLSGSKPPKLGDHSSPDAIRVAFGLSKKAFKRAVGRLLKNREVTTDDEGNLLVEPKKPRRGSAS